MLLQQLLDEQRNLGYTITQNIVMQVQVVGNSLGDKAYMYGAIRTNFSSLGGHDLIERTVMKTFKGSDGNDGEYYIVFDRK